MSYYQFSNHNEHSVGSAGYKSLTDSCNTYSYLSPQLDYGSSRGYSQQSSAHYSTSSGYNQQSRSDYLSNTSYTQSQTISPYYSSASYSIPYSKSTYVSPYTSTYTTQSNSFRRAGFGQRSIMSIDTTNADPVTKAVLSNMMGTAPIKQKISNLKCDVCCITSLSQSTMDTHLAGAKHAKKVKEKELEEKKALTDHPGIKKNGSVFRCTLCESDMNSLHQLQAHVNGTKHKTKQNTPANGANADAGGKKPADNAVTAAAATATPSAAAAAQKGSGLVVAGSASGPGEKPKVENKEITQYYCTCCNVYSNSETQYEQHVSSRKHHLRNSGRKIPRKPYTKVSSNNIVTSGGNANGQVLKGRFKQLYSRQPVPLSASFVSGGVVD